MKINFNHCTGLVSLGVILAVFSAVAAALLGWVSTATRPAIDAARARRSIEAMRKVLPAGFVNNPAADAVTVDGVTFFGAFDRDGRLLAVAGQFAAGSGYAGPVELLVGLTPEGAVRSVAEGRSAVVVTASGETPGLGSVVTDRKQETVITDLFAPAEEMPANPVLDGFAGHAAGGAVWKIRKDGGDFAFKSGATITSRAVTEAVCRIVSVYAANRRSIEAALAAANQGDSAS